MHVLITGATGRLGRYAVEELERHGHELVLVSRRPPAEARWVAADLALPGEWEAAFRGVDTVVHLAGNPAVDAPWEILLRDNVAATWNVVEAAAAHGVRRVVFASSRRAVLALEEELAPACYQPHGPKIGSDAPPRPLQPYGLSKAAGELIGRAAVDAGRLESFLALRIGTHHLDPPREDSALLRRWIAPADLRTLLVRAVEAEFTGFHVGYGVSAQATSPYDLTHTKRLLGWEPRALP